MRRSFLARTLNLTIGRFAVEARRELLRRRRRSRRASAEKKRRTAQATAITASTPKITNRMGFSKFIENYLTHAFGM